MQTLTWWKSRKRPEERNFSLPFHRHHPRYVCDTHCDLSIQNL